jgi:parvulin-like peptidyl-prolyl isomerase
MEKVVHQKITRLHVLVFSICLVTATIMPAQQSPDPVVIELGEHQVSLSEFNATFRVALRMLAAQQGIGIGNQDAGTIERLRNQYLGQRANELALLQEARQRGITAPDTDVLAQTAEMRERISADESTDEVLDEVRLLELVREKQMVALLSEQLLDEIVVRPGDVVVLHHDIQEEIKRPEQICLRHIVLEDEAKANVLITQLNGGADFAELAKANSTDAKTADNGGDMGCFAREGLIARSEFEKAAFNASLNELTGPVKSEFGYHLLVVYKRIAAHVPTLNEAFAELEQEIRHERLPQKLMEIRDASGVKTYPERLGSG